MLRRCKGTTFFLYVKYYNQNLFFSSLIRTSELRSKVLTFDNKSKKILFCFVLFSLNRTFAPKF